jgi:PAS domain S-box-containing protein
MTGAYAYTPDIWLPLAGAIFLAAIGVHCWRRRSVPAALPLLAVTLFGALWMLGIAFEAAAVAPATKIAWFRFQAVWRAPTVTAGLCFVLEFAYPGRWLTRRNLILLSIPVLLDILLVIINDAQWMWRRVEVGSAGSVVADVAPAGVILAVYGVGLVLVNTAVLLWLFIRSPQHRWPVVVILLGHIASRGLYVVDAAHLPWPNLQDPLVVGLLLGATGYAIALFGFHIFDPVPAARIAALEQMRDGMVVFDPEWRVAALNRAAGCILGVSAGAVRGKRPAEILPAFGDLSAHQAAAPGERFEIGMGTGAGARSYEIDVSPFHDFRGLLMGYLLMLRDVSERKRAEAQILEQQRSLAILGEREQLARELHDGIGQVMAYAGLQLEVVHDGIQGGRTALSAGQVADADAHLVEAGSHVTRLRSIVEEAHADVREYILNLRLAPSGQRPFFAALRHYLDGFSQNYGIRTELAVGTGVDAGKLNPRAQMQLFRIIQEALSNARKHAGATCVQLAFEAVDGRLAVRVQDNGCGFDPGAAARQADGHLGLHIMHERAEAIGGSLCVNSAPGEGTYVQVVVPVH